MADKQRDYQSELRQLMNGLADAVAEASDEEVMAYALEQGVDPEAGP